MLEPLRVEAGLAFRLRGVMARRRPMAFVKVGDAVCDDLLEWAPLLGP